MDIPLDLEHVNSHTPGGKSLSFRVGVPIFEPSSVTNYSTFTTYLCPIFPRCAEWSYSAPAVMLVALRGCSGMEHILCRPELRMFSIALGGPRMGGPLLFVLQQNKKQH